MKLLLVLASSTLLITGCANKNFGPYDPSHSVNSPPGTDVGTSNPGVNQPTTTTTATRADNPTPETPNSKR